MKMKYLYLNRGRTPDETAEMLDTLSVAKRGEVVCVMPGGMKAAGDPPEGDGGEPDDRLLIDFVLSTETPDRYDDVIMQDKWDLDNWKLNPVVLFGHDYSMPPIAKGSNPRVEDNKLKATAEFTPQSMYKFGYMIYEMVKEGFLNAVSVGFWPKEWTFDEERGGFNFLRNELWEFSVVDIPGNPEALAELQALGVDTQPRVEWARRSLGAPSEGHSLIWLPPGAVALPHSDGMELRVQPAEDRQSMIVLSALTRMDDGDVEYVFDTPQTLDVIPPETEAAEEPETEPPADDDIQATDDMAGLTDDVAELAGTLATMSAEVRDVKTMLARLVALKGQAAGDDDEPADDADGDDLPREEVAEIIRTVMKAQLATDAGRLPD